MEVHHKISFSLLYKKVFQDINLPIYDDIKKYTTDQLKLVDKKFIEYHINNNILVVLHKNIHRKFHKIYGYKNNTIEQFDEFVNKHFK